MYGQYEAKEFLDSVFKGIKHGDKKHQAWLKTELMKYQSDLEDTIEAAFQDGQEDITERIQRLL